MTNRFKSTFITRVFNVLIITLLRMGFKVGHMALITVRGRKSGQLRTTPIWLTEQNGQRWLMSPYGQVNWVRNLRAAGEATFTSGGRAEHVAVVEPETYEAAARLKQSLKEAPSFLHAYFNMKPDSPLEDFVRELPNHPIFVLQKVIG